MQPIKQVQAAPPSGFTLAFEDNFDGTTLDTSKWGYRTNSGCIGFRTYVQSAGIDNVVAK